MTTLEQHVQKCITDFGNPTAIESCSSNCNGVIQRVSNEIKPVWFCPVHKRLWDNPDGSAHDEVVLKCARTFYGIDTSATDHTDQLPTANCHGACHAISLSHTLARDGHWRPPNVCVVFCPVHKYMHACRADETPCNSCYTCSKGLWCIYRCRGTHVPQNSTAQQGEDKDSRIKCYTCINGIRCSKHTDGNAKPWVQIGEPVCTWSGRIMSNIDAPITKPTKQQETAITTSRVNELLATVKNSPGKIIKKPDLSVGKQVRRRSAACSEAYIKKWLCNVTTSTEYRDIPELVGSWHAASEDWPTTLHISGWVYLLSSRYNNSALLGLKVREARRLWIDALADTQFGKKNAASCADAIVCHLMQNPIRDAVLQKIRRDFSLFEK